MDVSNPSNTRIPTKKIRYGLIAGIAVLIATTLIVGSVLGVFSLGGSATVSVTSTTTTTTTTVSVTPATAAVLVSVTVGGTPCTVSVDQLSFSCDLSSSPVPISVTETDTTTTTIGGGTSVSTSDSTPIFGTEDLVITIQNTGSTDMTPSSVHAGSSNTAVVSISGDPTPALITAGSQASYTWTLTAVSAGTSIISGSIVG